MQNLGKPAQRLSLDQADLSTTSGRELLFQRILMYRPQTIWFSPTCGPWSAWSNFNPNRSLDSFDLIHQQRQELLYQLALGIVLLRHQFQLGYHLHWEQPRRSIMFATPLLGELYDKTWEAHFDMCRMGLKILYHNCPFRKAWPYEQHPRVCLRVSMVDVAERTTTIKCWKEIHISKG